MTFATLIDCALLGIGLYLVLARQRIVAKITDPERKARADRALRFAGPFAIVGGVLAALTQVSTPEDPAVLAAREINGSGPRMVDSTTRFDRATAGPGPQVVIDATITTITSAQLQQKKWEAAVPELRKRIGASISGTISDQGLTVVYRFYDKNGLLIGEIVFPPPNSKKP